MYSKHHPELVTITCLECKLVLHDDRLRDIIIESSAFGGVQGAPGEAGLKYNGVNSGINTLGLGGTTSDNIPAAFLNYLLFDKDYNYITGGYQRVTSSTFTKQKLSFLPIVVTQPGYMFVYVSNESNTANWVSFDDMKISYQKSPVIQADDYYPFGLTFNSYSRENSVANQYLYNGKEKQDELGLDWLDYGARMYMPELGRWLKVDKKAELYANMTPYCYAANTPTNAIDPDGNLVIFINGFPWGMVVQEVIGKKQSLKGSTLLTKMVW